MMIIVDKPYISDFFLETIKKNGYPVLKNEFALSAGLADYDNLLDEVDAVNQLKNKENPLVYMPTENSVGWVMDNLGFTRLPKVIRLFKDKVESRKLMQAMYPDYYFREVELPELETLDISDIPKPFMIKPSVGFCSFAVCKVENQADWESARQEITKAIAVANSVYPAHVLDFNTFIIEEFIEGDEFAFDACFDRSGNPVVYSAYQHIFASEDDVSDRLYVTSAEIVKKYQPVFTRFLSELGELREFKNVPLHVEVRIDSRGRLIPIEINPLRFGGMCTTTDLAACAYGFNPYEYCFAGQAPDWEEKLKGREDYLYGMVLLNNSTGVEIDQITSFDHDALAKQFENVLEIRKIDHKEFHFFGFLFIKTGKENVSELEMILHADLREYIST